MKETYERPVNKTEFSFAEREDVVHFLRVTLQQSEIDMYIYRIAAGWMDGIPYQYQKTDRNGRLHLETKTRLLRDSARFALFQPILLKIVHIVF